MVLVVRVVIAVVVVQNLDLIKNILVNNMDIKLIMEGEEWDNVVCACAKNKIKNTHSFFKKLKCSFHLF